jgi:hypothetical protein
MAGGPASAVAGAGRARGQLGPDSGRRGRTMSEEEEQEIRQELIRLRQEHRDLDAAIDALATTGRADNLTVQRLKKRKLAIKDRMHHLEDRLVPDIIA